MFNKYRDQAVSSSDSESDPSTLNRGFYRSSVADSIRHFESTNFTSTEAIHTTNTDESDLRHIIENDKYLNTVTKNDTLPTRNRSPSMIIAAGNSHGSTANISIESLQSTIINGAMDSDASYYSPNETFTNINFSTKHLLDKRLSSDDEFTDCESSLESQQQKTISTISTKYKSLRKIFSPNSRSDNNNTIIKELSKSPVSKSPDSGIALNAASNITEKFLDLPLYLQHLTTILEETTTSSKRNSRRISGIQLMPIIENLRKGPMPNIPKTVKFNETINSFAQILDKSSKEITIDQLAQILHFILQIDYNYSDQLNESESYVSSREISRISGIDSDNTGKELDSIIRQLQSMCPEDKKIESESSPEWHSSLTTLASRTPKNILRPSKMNHRPSSKNKKEYFPSLSPTDGEFNKENFNSKRHREAAIKSPKKNKVTFSSKSCQSSNLNTNYGRIQKNKYFATPRLKKHEEISKTKKFDSTTASEESFLLWEQKFIREEKQNHRNLRRSLSMPNIVSEESTTSVVFQFDHRKDKQKLRKIPGYDGKKQEKTKKYTKRRSKSVDYKNHFPVRIDFYCNNDSSKDKPSTSGLQRKKTLSHQKMYKLTVQSGDISALKTPTKIGVQKRTPRKNTSHLKTPVKTPRRRSAVIDNSHIPAVSQLRRVFSPATRGQELQVKINVPRIEITKPPLEQCNSPTPILALRSRKNSSKLQDKTLPRKPWKP